MAIIYFIILFFAGIVIGAFVNAQCWLPLIYGLPKSVYLFIKGRVRFLAIPKQLVSPFIWYFMLTGTYVFTNEFAPFIHDQILFSPGFTIGWMFSLIGLILNFFSKKGRNEMADDYNRTTFKEFSNNEELVSSEKEESASEFQKRAKSEVQHLVDNLNYWTSKKELKEPTDELNFQAATSKDRKRMIAMISAKRKTSKQIYQEIKKNI